MPKHEDVTCEITAKEARTIIDILSSAGEDSEFDFWDKVALALDNAQGEVFNRPGEKIRLVIEITG